MHTNTFQRLRERLLRAAGVTFLFAACGALSFFVGFRSVDGVDPIGVTEAQQTRTTNVNVLFQYRSIAGAVHPIAVTEVMNPSQNALVNLQEIHTGNVFPVNPALRPCRSTSAAGRCTIPGVPVGGTPESQYDLIVDTVLIEFVTGIPLVDDNSIVRFDRAACGNQTSFDGPTWCITQQNGTFAAEYFITVTLKERDTCVDALPPANFCDSDPRRIIRFACNPSTAAPTRPWEPAPEVCGPTQCPDGTIVDGKCGHIGTGLAACAMAFSCADHQLCEVRNFGTNISHNAGSDTIVIRGKRFGTAGGTVSFPVLPSGREVVHVFPGPSWTDTEIRVRVPLQAVSGVLEIHPNSHGSFEENGQLVPVTCSSPPANIRAFIDQFAILSVNAVTPNGVQLVSPGFATTFTLLVHHNDAVQRLQSIVVDLLQGAFPDPHALPIQRTVITQAECPVEIRGSGSAHETTLTCIIPIPQSVAPFSGPYTFVITLMDDRGNSVRAVRLDGGTSAMLGDFTLDGALTIEDAARAFRIARGAVPALPAHLDRDTNKDGKITLADALVVLHSLTE